MQQVARVRAGWPEKRQRAWQLLALLALGACEGQLLDGPQVSPPAPVTDAGTAHPADEGGATPVDAGVDEPDAAVEVPDAGNETPPADAGAPDAGSVVVDGGVYPGLPASCQGLLNRTHGTCADAYANPNYGSIAWDFKGDVDQAIAAVGQPTGFFDGDTVFPAKRDAYARLVAAQLDAQQRCAVWAGGELYVRDRVRDSNETFSLFTQSGRPRAGGHWQCAPSDPIPGTAPAFTCSLPAGTGTNCNASGQNFFGDVVTMVEEVILEEQQKPSSAIIDFRFKSQHVRGWRLKDDGYPFVEAVARKANARGYCVASSGWKWVNLKQGSNALSEKYSLVTHVSLPDPARDPALYAACQGDGILPSCEFIIEKGEDTCRPADF